MIDDHSFYQDYQIENLNSKLFEIDTAMRKLSTISLKVVSEIDIITKKRPWIVSVYHSVCLCFRRAKKCLMAVFYLTGILCTTATIWTSVSKYLSYPSRNVLRVDETLLNRDL